MNYFMRTHALVVVVAVVATSAWANTAAAFPAVPLHWDDPLTLCGSWREGHTIAEEEARKVRLTILPAHRGSMARNDLENVGLVGVTLRRGPTSASETFVGPSRIRTRLSEYREDETHMQAVLEHTLHNVGILRETISGYREMDLTGYRYESMGGVAAFTFQPEGSPETETQHVGACDGGPMRRLYDNMQILTARRGDDTVTVTRTLRTLVAMAGTAPVFVDSVKVGITQNGRSMVQRTAKGYWPITYAADHHNWNESLAVDFAKDAAAAFAPNIPRANGDTLGSIHISGMTSPGEQHIPRLHITWKTPNGAAAQEEWQVEGKRWFNIGAAVLAQGAACEGRTVAVLSNWDNYTFHTVTCPPAADAGTDFRQLVGIVPVQFPANPSVVGKYIPSSEIRAVQVENGTPAYEITLGAHRLLIVKAGEPYTGVRILKGDGSVIERFLSQSYPIPASLAQEHTIVLQSADASVVVTLVRRWAGQGVGESSIFAPVSFMVKHGTKIYYAESTDGMTYQNTHHNWNDVWTALVPDAKMKWQVDYVGGETGTYLVQKVEIIGNNGEVLLPETLVNDLERP